MARLKIKLVPKPLPPPNHLIKEGETINLKLHNKMVKGFLKMGMRIDTDNKGHYLINFKNTHMQFTFSIKATDFNKARIRKITRIIVRQFKNDMRKVLWETSGNEEGKLNEPVKQNVIFKNDNL